MNINNLKSNNNYLLKLGAGFISCTLILKFVLFYFSDEIIPKSSRISIFDINPILLLISTILIMPIIEELTFRGMFSKNKFGNYFFYFLVPVFIWSSKNYYTFILYILIVIIIRIYEKTKNKKALLFIYIINSILFSVLHYAKTDFTLFSKIVPMFFQLGMGFILIWITINRKLSYSIILHIIVNLIIITPIFFTLQNPNTKITTLRKHGFELTWQKVPIFTNGANLRLQQGDKEINVENVSIRKYYNLLLIQKPIYEVKSENEFYHFNIKIKNLDNNTGKIDSLKIQQLLYDAGLVE